MKKFMILMLSLAVLFSFAACDNSNNGPESTVGAVARIYSTNIPQYLTGEKISLSDFNLVGEDMNGNEVEINADDIVVVDSAALKAADEAGRKSVTKDALSYKGAAIVSLYYDAYTIDADSLKVVAPSEKEEYFVDSIDKGFDFNYSKYTVTVTYTVNNEKVTKTLDAADDEYTVTYDDQTVKNDVPVTFKTAVGAAVGSEQSDATTVKVNVIDDPVVDIVAELVDADALIYSNASAAAVAGGDYTSIINVYEKLESGYVDEDNPIAKGAALTFEPAEGLIVTNDEDAKVYGAADTYAVTAKYTVGSATYDDSVDVVITADKIESITAEVRSGSETATKGVAAGKTINKADIKVTATYASSVTDELEATEFTLDPEVMPEGATGSYKISVVLNSDNTKKAEVSINVAAAATVEDKEFDWKADGLTLTGTDWSTNKTGTLTVYAPGDYDGTALTETTNYTVSVVAGDAGAYVVTVTGAADTEYADFSVTIDVPADGLTGNSEE